MLVSLRKPLHNVSFASDLLTDDSTEVTALTDRLLNREVVQIPLSEHLGRKWAQEYKQIYNCLSKSHPQCDLLPLPKLHTKFLQLASELDGQYGQLPLLGFRKFAKWILIDAYMKLEHGIDLRQGDFFLEQGPQEATFDSLSLPRRPSLVIAGLTSIAYFYRQRANDQRAIGRRSAIGHESVCPQCLKKKCQ